MKRLSVATIILSLLFMSFSYAAAQDKSFDNSPAKVQEIVYEEILPDKQKVVVLREEVPYTPPSKEEKEKTEKKRAEILKRFPDARFVDRKPDRVSQYSLFLDSADSKSRHLLWQRTVPEYLKPFWKKAPDRKFFDVSLESGTLVILHAFGSGPLIGEVVKMGETKINKDIKPNWVMPISIKISMPIGVPFIESSSIEGSLNKGDLAIVAKKIDGEVSRFLWKNDKWEEQKPPSPSIQPSTEQR